MIGLAPPRLSEKRTPAGHLFGGAIMGMNKNTWHKDYTGAPGIKKLGQMDKERKGK